MRRIAAALLSASCIAFAQGGEVDVNTASQAQLESLRGIGVALSERLLEERGRRPYTDWNDLAARVPGVGPKLAERLSAQGLRVGGRPFAERGAR